MAFYDQFTKAVSGALAKARPSTVAGPLLTGGKDRFAAYDATVAARKAQKARVAAYEKWRAEGGRQGLWVKFVGFQQLARGRWLPVHSSNVSAVRWQPIDPLASSTTEDLLAEAAIKARGGPVYEGYQEMTDISLVVGPGHGTEMVNIKGRLVPTRDTQQIRSMLTPTEWKAFQERMLFARPQRASNPPMDKRWLNKVIPSTRGRRITEDTNGILFERFLDTRIYMYPHIKLGEAMDCLQSPSKGRWTWAHLRLAGRDYQQISGPPVQYRVGKGH